MENNVDKVESDIAIHCDEPDQVSAHEMFKTLDSQGYVYIKCEIVFYDEILEMLDDNDYGNADNNEITKMFIDKIAELIE